jgi:uracil-DNA glycosylase
LFSNLEDVNIFRYRQSENIFILRAANMIPEIPVSWRKYLAGEREKPYFAELERFVADEQEHHTVYPPADKIFTALKLTSYEDTRVLLLGQDPYIKKGQAHGLCFSVEDKSQPIPPSLRNIYKELKDDVKVTPPHHANLTSWAKQGILMLNVVLTVREGQSNSHKNKGWETFTNEIIRLVSEKQESVVFVLWGKDAQKKIPLIDEGKHTIVQGAHPSPLARGFLGSRPFSKINQALREAKRGEIDWRIPD